MNYCVYNSPVGELVLTERDGKLVALSFGVKPEAAVKEHKSEFLKSVCKKLDGYFAGEIKQFDIPVEFVGGTPFTRKVWEFLLTLPYGTSATYRDAARYAGNEKAVRAAGSAVGHNPIAIIVPCHRIIGSDGCITGFTGGLDKKRYLLNLEHISYKE